MSEKDKKLTSIAGELEERDDVISRRILDIRLRPVLLYLIIFLLMMISSLLLFSAAEIGSQPAMVFFLVLVISGNLLCLIS